MTRNRPSSPQSFLLAAMLGLGIVSGVAAGYWQGAAGVSAVAGAGLACWMGTALALWFQQALPGPAFALHALLLSIFARTGIPLISALLAHLYGGLDKGGFVYYLLMFYFVGLGVEVVFSLPSNLPRSGAGQGRSSDSLSRSTKDGIEQPRTGSR